MKRIAANWVLVAVAALVGSACSGATSTADDRRAIGVEDSSRPASTDVSAAPPTSVASPSASDAPPTSPDGDEPRGDGEVADEPEPAAAQVTIVPFDEHAYDETNRGVEWRFSLRALAADRYEYAFFNPAYPGFVVRHILEDRQDGVYDWGDPECPWSEPIVFVPFDATAAGSSRTSCVTSTGRAIVREQTVEVISNDADAIRYRISAEEYTEWSDGPQTTSTVDDYVFDRSLGWHTAWRATIRYDDDDGISGPYEYRYERRSTDPAN